MYKDMSLTMSLTTGQKNPALLLDTEIPLG